MKKILSLTLSFIMLITLASCGQNNAENSDSKTKETAIESSTQIVNDRGTEFEIGLNKKGEILENGNSIDSNEIEIVGKTYKFPMRVSELLNNGWSFSKNLSFKNEFKPGKTNLISFHMYDGQGNEIDLSQAYNDGQETAKIEDCLLYGLELAPNRISDFKLPGEIYTLSYAADVLEVFGDPNVHSGFKNGYNQANGLYYFVQDNSKISYLFSFYDNSQLAEYREHISSVSVEYLSE